MKTVYIKYFFLTIFFLAINPLMAQTLTPTVSNSPTPTLFGSPVPTATVTPTFNPSQIAQATKTAENIIFNTLKSYPCPSNLKEKDFHDLVFNQIKGQLKLEGSNTPTVTWYHGTIEGNPLSIAKVDLHNRQWIGVAFSGTGYGPDDTWYYMVRKAGERFQLQRFYETQDDITYVVFVKKADLIKAHFELAVHSRQHMNAYFYLSPLKGLKYVFEFADNPNSHNSKAQSGCRQHTTQEMTFTQMDWIKITTTDYICEKTEDEAKPSDSDQNQRLSEPYTTEKYYQWDTIQEAYILKSDQLTQKKCFEPADLGFGQPAIPAGNAWLKITDPASVTLTNQQDLAITKDTAGPVVQTAAFFPPNFRLTFQFFFSHSAVKSQALASPVGPNTPYLNVPNGGTTLKFYVVSSPSSDQQILEGPVFALNDSDQFSDDVPPVYGLWVGNTDIDGSTNDIQFFSGRYIENFTGNPKGLEGSPLPGQWNEAALDKWFQASISLISGKFLLSVQDAQGKPLFNSDEDYPGYAPSSDVNNLLSDFSEVQKLNRPLKLYLWGRGGQTLFKNFCLETTDFEERPVINQ